MKVGDRLRVTKSKDGKNAVSRNNRTAILEYIDRYKITVMYQKEDEKYYSECFTLVDILTGRALIDIKECNYWRRITKEDFKI